jgi:hypothetical protein
LPESIEQDDIPIPHDFEAEPFGLFILHPSPDIYLPSTDIDAEYADSTNLVVLIPYAFTDSM